MLEQQRLGGPQHGQMRHASQQQQEHRLNVISPPNALVISELIETVGRHLDRHSLTLCLRVCRQWYQVLRDQLWEVIEMVMGEYSPDDDYKPKSPSLPLLRKHADLVRKLFLQVNAAQIVVPDQPALYCPRLTELTAWEHWFSRLDHTNGLFEENLAVFIVEHRATLKKLDLGANQSKAVMEAMIACSNLHSLKIQAPFLSEAKELDVWRHWYESLGSRLRNLKLFLDSPITTHNEFIMDKSMDGLLSQTSSGSLRNLELQGRGATLASLQGQMLLVMKSPELRHLSWSITNSRATMTLLAEAFEKSLQGLFCQRLESLKLPNHGDFTLEEFQRVMRSLPALRDLELRGHNALLPRSIPSYMTTLSTLRKLKIAGYRWVTPSVVQEILCSMPHLEVFETDTLSDTAIQKDPRPWACKGLRELRLSLAVHSDVPFSVDGTAEAVMLDRLCQLEGLQKLRIPKAAIYASDGDSEDLFKFQVDRGLDKLKTLRHLRSFVLHKGQFWKEAEARWVLENWTQLRELGVDMEIEAKELLSHQLLKTPLNDFNS